MRDKKDIKDIRDKKDIYDKFRKSPDEELIRIFVSDPESSFGLIAKEILEYRKFKTARGLNYIIAFLTAMIAIATVFQVVIVIMRCAQ